jgi:hypothetical protein
VFLRGLSGGGLDASPRLEGYCDAQNLTHRYLQTYRIKKVSIGGLISSGELAVTGIIFSLGTRDVRSRTQNGRSDTPEHSGVHVDLYPAWKPIMHSLQAS